MIKVNVDGEGVSTGAGGYLVKIPITGTVSDPSKLLLKVQTSVGPVYPVAGVYDSGAKVFTAELMRLWNGWNMGVVARPDLWATTTSLEEDGNTAAQSWVTPTDWQTCSWSINASLPNSSATTAFAAEVKAALVKACQHLSGAGFRSPKLWIDGRLNPKARVAHIVRGTGANSPTTSFCMPGVPEEDPKFTHIGFNDEQMHSLGQLYFNWDEWQAFISPAGWSVGHVAIHELFHGVQYGYDVRDPWWNGRHPLMWISEGTATVVGMTYQTNTNGINGGTVTVRPQEPPQILDEKVPIDLGGELAVAKAVHQVIVDQATGLHVGVGNGRAHEGKAAGLQCRGQGHCLRRDRRHLGHGLPRIELWSAAHKRPNEGIERAGLRLNFKKRPGVAHCRADLGAVANDAGITRKLLDHPVVEGGDHGGVEPGKGPSITLPAVQHGAPRQSRLGTFQDEKLEMDAVVVDGRAPLQVVVGLHERIITNPRAALAHVSLP